MLYTGEEIIKILEPRIREMFHGSRSDGNIIFDKRKYSVKTWDQVKDIRHIPGFYDHAILITDPLYVEKYGHSAYYVEKNWIDNFLKNFLDK